MNHLGQSLLALSLATAAQGADYFLSDAGDDQRDGIAPERAWRTLERVPVARLRPGDRILLRGGDQFHGSLLLSVSGAPDQPITVASFGTGRAAILPPPGINGVTIRDAGHLVVRDLDLRGPGVGAVQDGCGLLLDAVGARSVGIAITDVSCSDFPQHGIRLGAVAVDAGFADVLIDRVACHGNGQGGLGAWGPVSGTHYAFHRVVVRDSVFHGNRGLPAKRDNHSGNGIILGDCSDSVIERCAAWGNGDLCNSAVGGPVGIWLCESDRSVIRGCVSFRNRTGAGVPDGGGFDLDGGCTRCVIEDCLSWRNDGAGYLLYQYKEAREFRGNVLRNCFSVGDGRARNNGGIYIGTERPGEVHELDIQRNTVVIDGGPSLPAALRVVSPVDAVRIHGNRFIALGGAELFNDAALAGVTLTGNTWCAAAPRVLGAGLVQPLPPGEDLRGPPAGLAAGLPEVIDAAWCAALDVPGCGATALRRYGPAPR